MHINEHHVTGPQPCPQEESSILFQNHTEHHLCHNSDTQTLRSILHQLSPYNFTSIHKPHKHIPSVDADYLSCTRTLPYLSSPPEQQQLDERIVAATRAVKAASPQARATTFDLAFCISSSFHSGTLSQSSIFRTELYTHDAYLYQ